MKELIYSVINFFTFGRGLQKTFHGFAVRLPTRYINYFPAEYEKDNFEFLKKTVKTGDTVLDIGAHIGLFSVVAAKITGNNGKVYAFEPAPATNALLQQTIRINKLENTIEGRNEAMGKENGKTVFFISDVVGDNSNSLVSYKVDRELKGIDITVMSIDSFAKEKNIKKINFIKIDVEGAEYDTIRGADATMTSHRPFISIGLHPNGITAKGDNLGDIYDFIIQHKYEVIYHDKSMSRDEFCSETDLFDVHLMPL